MAPVVCVRLLVALPPVKLKLPFQLIALVMVTAAPEVLLMKAVLKLPTLLLEAIVKAVLVPRAFALLMLRSPTLNVTPPLKVLVPARVLVA